MSRAAPVAETRPVPRALESAVAREEGIALHLRGLCKSFGTARVLEDVDFSVRAGEIHALLGENGAGKSTLMNILGGIYAADSGGVEIAGRAVSINAPAQALSLGIGMVHQHFRLAGPFTARENVALAAGALPELRGRGRLEARLSEAMARTGLEVPLDRPVERLSVADRQRIEILKALSLGARILILDEPTAVLTDEEAGRLLALMRKLAEDGHAIVFITHKLREVIAAGDRVSVLRRGRMVLEGRPVAGIDAETLARAMMGEEAVARTDPGPAAPRREPGEVLLSAEALSVAADAGQGGVHAVSLSLSAGEIAGIAGVGGNGQQELAEALVGLRPMSAGRLVLKGRELSSAPVGARRDLGLRYIPSDRARFALALNAPLSHNIAAGEVRTGALGRALLSPGRLRALAARLIAAFDIAGATAGGARPVRLLSGGNAQKAVLARELDDAARLIIAHSPTRGLDVAACRHVHDRLLEAAGRGAAVLIISEDIEEIMALSDTIHVMSRGRLTSPQGPRPDRAAIGRLMLGHA
ncbi:MAG: ABC transporter ATP-binding protein [Rhodobacteraceae bacterium]|nr:ABC transporter ATP-binding protein [Paracoccaceae bacterium]